MSLADGNTVVRRHAANPGIAMAGVTPGHRIMWTSDHPLAVVMHHFQIFTTAGRPEPGMVK